MNIGLWNLEPKVENTALMQVSQHHKQQGDSVEFYSPLFEYDKVYVFSLFSFTKKPKLKSNMVAGGTGFDIFSKLPSEIENGDLDYSIYPNCKTSYLWFSRGCFRKCPFCIVPQKEGNIHPVQPHNLNPNGRTVTITDNNFFANPKWKDAIDYLERAKQPVNFQQGIDVRIFNESQGEALKKLRFSKQIKIAWDNPKDDLSGKIAELIRYVAHSKIMCFVLIGYWSTPEEDEMRIEALDKLGIDPYVMRYSKTNPYQMAFQRFVNHLRHSRNKMNLKFKDYKHGKLSGADLLCYSSGDDNSK